MNWMCSASNLDENPQPCMSMVFPLKANHIEAGDRHKETCALAALAGDPRWKLEWKQCFLECSENLQSDSSDVSCILLFYFNATFFFGYTFFLRLDIADF